MNSPLVKSASRVLDLIEILALTPRALGVTELSQRLGIPKSSTSMLLATLEARGYVMVDPARRFRLADELRGGGDYVPIPGYAYDCHTHDDCDGGGDYDCLRYCYCDCWHGCK